MCGIIGFTGKASTDKFAKVASYRGPDNTTIGQYGNFTLAHNRLAIIDLSPEANQPFVSDCGNYVIVFNGEVYNFQEIRDRLANKYPFRTRCDTEVILYNYIEKGERCVDDFIGMFAFAVLDIRNQKIFAARDRLGIKPLVYYHKDSTFIFASEIKVILSLLDHKPAINRSAIAQYLTYLYVPQPSSIYESIYKLPAGHCMTFHNRQLDIKPYWTPTSNSSETGDNEEELVKQLDELLTSAVNLRMIADVKLGTFLSGGLDSTSILYYMARNSSTPINTFTLGFPNAKLYDERDDAKQVADFFKTDHHEILIEPNITELLSKMVFHFDEPFGNPTALLIHELTKETRKYATVALVGDGGDEVFGGYPRYKAACLYERLKWVPKPFWKMMNPVFRMVPESTSGFHALRRIKTFVASLGKSEHAMYEDWIGYFSNRELDQLFCEPCPYDHVVQDLSQRFSQTDFPTRTALIDFESFLPNNILAYGDAMSMANGFETRLPLVDHRIVEFMMTAAKHYRVRDGQTKYLLRRVLEPHVPERVLKKPKLGLNPPVGQWLKKDLQPLVDDYLSPQTIKKRGLFKEDEVQKLINEHYRNTRDRSLYLWALIVLEEWFRQYE